MATDPTAAFGATNCPLITPFEDSTANGEGSGGERGGEREGIDTDALASLVEVLIDRGLDGLVPCGTTGEFASLTEKEYRTVIETTAGAAGDRAPVMAGAATTTVETTLDRLEAAAESGADAGLVTLPYFHGANVPEGEARFFRAIAAETPLPVYLYNIPGCVGREVPLETVAAVAEEESIVGCKDSSGDFEYFLEVDRHTPTEFALYQGYDSYFVPGLAAGSAGGINALANAIPESFVAASEAVRAEKYERAREIQTTEIAPLFELCLAHGFAPASKAAAAARGFLPDTAVRPPLMDLDRETRAEIDETVASVATNYE
jgi:4-hydroxy-tetrahydrodipicolinate synthase